jgi:hypothetical protein
MKIYYKENIEMKNLRKLFINAEEVYGKKLIDKFRQKIYDIG